MSTLSTLHGTPSIMTNPFGFSSFITAVVFSNSSPLNYFISLVDIKINFLFDFKPDFYLIAIAISSLFTVTRLA
jgi:hypothetical protein